MFPFQDIPLDGIEECSDLIEDLLVVRGKLDEFGLETSNTTFEGLAFAFEYLRRKKHYSFQDKVFVDCFGSSAESCVYAAAFGFSNLLSAEMCADTCEEAGAVLDYLKSIYYIPEVAKPDKSRKSEDDKRVELPCSPLPPDRLIGLSKAESRKGLILAASKNEMKGEDKNGTHPNVGDTKGAVDTGYGSKDDLGYGTGASDAWRGYTNVETTSPDLHSQSQQTYTQSHSQSHEQLSLRTLMSLGDLERIGASFVFFDKLPPATFDCIFLNVTSFRASFLDEGALLVRFFPFCLTQKSLSYVILITQEYAEVELSDYIDVQDEGEIEEDLRSLNSYTSKSRSRSRSMGSISSSVTTANRKLEYVISATVGTSSSDLSEGGMGTNCGGGKVTIFQVVPVHAHHRQSTLEGCMRK